MGIEDRKAEPPPGKRGALPRPTFIWIGPILGMGLYQRKIGNSLRPGIRKTRLMSGNVRGLKGLKRSREMKIFL
jgi:hypothetical protein